jgi:dolichol-phosphate mannosyltransferase
MQRPFSRLSNVGGAATHATFKVSDAAGLYAVPQGQAGRFAYIGLALAENQLLVQHLKAAKNFFLARPPICRRVNRADSQFPMNVTAAAGSDTYAEPHYSIVIPVYNEEDVVEGLLSELRSFAITWRSDYELLLVDDGSSDRTAEIIGNQFTNWSQARLIQLSRNCGQAAALFYGMTRARGQIVILLDGDGQNDPKDIPNILAPLNEVDMAVGIRVERRDSLVRRAMSRLANAARSRILGDGVVDSGCGIKAFHRRVVEAFIPMRTLYSFIPALAVSAGFTIRQVPVRHRPRRGGKSKYGVRQFLWKPLLDMAGVWWFARRRCPLATEKSGATTVQNE